MKKTEHDNAERASLSDAELGGLVSPITLLVIEPWLNGDPCEDCKDCEKVCCKLVERINSHVKEAQKNAILFALGHPIKAAESVGISKEEAFFLGRETVWQKDS